MIHAFRLFIISSCFCMHTLHALQLPQRAAQPNAELEVSLLHADYIPAEARAVSRSIINGLRSCGNAAAQQLLNFVKHPRMLGCVVNLTSIGLFSSGIGNIARIAVTGIVEPIDNGGSTCALLLAPLFAYQARRQLLKKLIKEIEKGNVNKVRYILGTGLIDINGGKCTRFITTNMWCPRLLIWAVRCRNAEVVKLLLEKGTDISLSDYDDCFIIPGTIEDYLHIYPDSSPWQRQRTIAVKKVILEYRLQQIAQTRCQLPAVVADAIKSLHTKMYGHNNTYQAKEVYFIVISYLVPDYMLPHKKPLLAYIREVKQCEHKEQELQEIVVHSEEDIKRSHDTSTQVIHHQ